MICTKHFFRSVYFAVKLLSAPIPKQSAEWLKKTVSKFSLTKRPKGHCAAERPKTLNNLIFIQIFSKMFHFLLAAFQSFGWKEVGCSFTFGLSAMQPFLGQKWQWKCNFYYQIALPAFFRLLQKIEQIVNRDIFFPFVAATLNRPKSQILHFSK